MAHHVFFMNGKVCGLLCILFTVNIESACAQTRPNDRMTSGYYGHVKLATKITWKNAPDSLLNAQQNFDSLYHLAYEIIAGHYAPLGKYFREKEQPGYVNAAIMQEAFDSAGNGIYEGDTMAANAMNVTYKYGKYIANKSKISIYNNHSGNKIGDGTVVWTGNNTRTQHISMVNGFVIDASLEIENNQPAKQRSKLKFKDAFTIDARTTLLSNTAGEQVWLHTEVSRNVDQKSVLPPTVDTVTHHILSKDTEGNILKETITHSSKKEVDEVAFHKYEYYTPNP